MTVDPRRLWRRVLPEAALGGSGLSLCGGVGRPELNRDIARILPVVPRQSGSQLLEVRVRLAAHDGAHDPAVAIDLVPGDDHILAEDQSGKILLRRLAECLGALRRVDAVETDLVLETILVEDSDRVAVGDTATTLPWRILQSRSFAARGTAVAIASQNSAPRVATRPIRLFTRPHHVCFMSVDTA